MLIKNDIFEYNPTPKKMTPDERISAEHGTILCNTYDAISAGADKDIWFDGFNVNEAGDVTELLYNDGTDALAYHIRNSKQPALGQLMMAPTGKAFGKITHTGSVNLLLSATKK